MTAIIQTIKDAKQDAKEFILYMFVRQETQLLHQGAFLNAEMDLKLIQNTAMTEISQIYQNAIQIVHLR